MNNWTRFYPKQNYRHIFKLRNGEVLICDPHDVKATLDKEYPGGPPVRVFEVRSAGGLIRRLWPGEIADWQQEPV